MKKSLSALSFALLFSGCLFSSNLGYDFKVELAGYFGPVYSYHTDGSKAPLLGVGLEQRMPASQGLQLVPDGGSYGVGSYFVRITRDSTFVTQLVETTPLPKTEPRESYRGAPCLFYNPQAFHAGVDSAGAVPLVVSGAHLTVSADTVRLALTIDTAASRAADPRADFSRRLMTGTVNVSCP